MNTRTTWGWLPPPDEGVWRYGAGWMKPFLAAAPYLALFVVLGTAALASGRFAAASGVAFDLPSGTPREAIATRLSAVVLRLVPETGNREETYVFFEDARYMPAHPASAAELVRAIGSRVASEPSGTLLLLADADVPTGELVALVDLIRRAGVRRVQVAERQAR